MRYVMSCIRNPYKLIIKFLGKIDMFITGCVGGKPEVTR